MDSHRVGPAAGSIGDGARVADARAKQRTADAGSRAAPKYRPRRQIAFAVSPRPSRHDAGHPPHARGDARGCGPREAWRSLQHLVERVSGVTSARRACGGGACPANGETFAFLGKRGVVAFELEARPVARENSGPRRADRNLWRQSPLKVTRHICVRSERPSFQGVCDETYTGNRKTDRHGGDRRLAGDGLRGPAARTAGGASRPRWLI